MKKFWGRHARPVHEPQIQVEDGSLRHVVLVGGSLKEWLDFGEEGWKRRIEELVRISLSKGAQFVSVYPYGAQLGDENLDISALSRRVSMSGVEVSVNPTTDGRQRICDVLKPLSVEPRAGSISEHDIDRLIFGEFGEPDLVVIVGPSDQLPGSLVWELAYSEMVFVESSWSGFDTAHIVSATTEYDSRHRRFGGVDT